LIGFPVDVTDDSIRIRQKNPGLFDPDSFKTITLKGVSGIKAVIGKLKGQDTTTIQTFIFDKSKWNLDKAKAWVKEHGSKYSTETNLYEDKGGSLTKLEFTQEEFDSKLKAEREAGKAEATKDAEKRFSADKEKIDALEQENKTLKEDAAKTRQANFQKFAQTEYDRLLKAKKLLPPEKDYFFKMAEKLSADDTEIEFSKDLKCTAFEAFVKNIENGPDKIDTSGKTDADDPNKKSLDTDKYSDFSASSEVSKKQAAFVDKVLEEKKIKPGDDNYRAEFRQAMRQAAKEITE